MGGPLPEKNGPNYSEIKMKAFYGFELISQGLNSSNVLHFIFYRLYCHLHLGKPINLTCVWPFVRTWQCSYFPSFRPSQSSFPHSLPPRSSGDDTFKYCSVHSCSYPFRPPQEVPTSAPAAGWLRWILFSSAWATARVYGMVTPGRVGPPWAEREDAI